MARTSTAHAQWNGKLKDGDGTFRAESKAFEGPYSFGTRFADAAGTNPEELLAAAHAACFSMALAADLEKAGTPATTIRTTAHCTMDTVDGKPTVKTMQLVTEGTVAGIDAGAFRKAADGAKANCPVSRALAGVAIELEATLAS